MLIKSARWADVHHTVLELQTDEGVVLTTRKGDRENFDRMAADLTIAPCFTLISAQYANADHTAVVAITKESGAVACSERDTPHLWRQLVASGLAIAPHQAPKT